MSLKVPTIKLPALLKISYLIFLVTAFFYVKSVLDVDSFKVTEKPVDKPAIKIKEISVSLLVEKGPEVKEYRTKLKNIDTVEDFLKELRDKQGLYYEKDLYTYGVDLVSVLDERPGEGKKWALLLGNKDITTNISDEYLVDDGVYSLKQITRTLEQ